MIRYIILSIFIVSIIGCTKKSKEQSATQTKQVQQPTPSPTTSEDVTTTITTKEEDDSKKIDKPSKKKDKSNKISKNKPKSKGQRKTDKIEEQSKPIISSSEFTVDYLMGKFNPKKHPDFTRIAQKYASNGGMLMRKDAYNSFIKMYNAAKKDGISLRIISAVRPFVHQKRIWEAKWTGKRQVDGKMLSKEVKEGAAQRALKILRWSSMPGTSRHHWGTDIDLNDLNNNYFERGKGAKIYQWLTENASTYGFCQVYSPLGKERPDGYQEEKWHWSYLPISKQLTALYKTQIQNRDISGFEGSESAELINIVDKYVLGINQDCQ